VSQSCPGWYLGLVELTGVGAVDDLAIGECDTDAVGGGLFIRAGAVQDKEVAGASSVSYGVLWGGWGTTRLG
jgi:hypothetical protein